MTVRLPTSIQPWLGVAGVLVLIELVVRVGLLPSRYFPPMTETFSALLGQLAESSYWSAVAHTLQGWAIGLAIAIVIAVPVGLALGFSEVLYRAARPIIEFLRPVPSVALIPLAILVYGTGLQSKVFLVVFAATWPLLIQTIYGARDLDPIQLETARSFRISRKDRILRVTLMGAVPYIATGLRISSAVALILAFTAELFMGTPGLGKLLNYAQSYGLTTQLYALALATGVLGVCTHLLFTAAERRALRWHPSQRMEAV